MLKKYSAKTCSVMSLLRFSTFQILFPSQIFLMALITGAGQLFLTLVWLLILFTHSVAYVGSAVLRIIYVLFKYFLSFLVESSSVDFLIRTLNVLYIELIKNSDPFQSHSLRQSLEVLIGSLRRINFLYQNYLF